MKIELSELEKMDIADDDFSDAIVQVVAIMSQHFIKQEEITVAEMAAFIGELKIPLSLAFAVGVYIGEEPGRVSAHGYGEAIQKGWLD